MRAIRDESSVILDHFQKCELVRPFPNTAGLHGICLLIGKFSEYRYCELKTRSASLRRFFLSLPRTVPKCFQRSSKFKKIKMSSKLTLTNFKSQNLSVIYLTNVPSALTSPKGLSMYSYSLDVITKAVL